MRKSGASKREPATEPTPLELVEIARALPTRQWEKACASQSYAERLQALKAALREARHVWQVAREVSAIEETFFDAAAKSDANWLAGRKPLMTARRGSWQLRLRSFSDGLPPFSAMLGARWSLGSSAKTNSSRNHSCSSLKAHKHKAEQEAKALKARRQRARRKGNASQK